ncbi:MAG: phosphogluconate dehydrogenase (NAD(+)-dependent, decarboxylating) [Ilumatobacteraceae bacterium]
MAGPVVAGTWHARSVQLGMIGLGRMGANMARRLEEHDHDCVGFDVNPAAVQAVVADGAGGAGTLEELVAQLEAPRHVWIMLPAGFVDATIDQLVPLLEAGDTIIDGGNSWYHNDVDRALQLAEHDIEYVDVGVSGGIHGLERGYCLMIGGNDGAVSELVPIFDALAPGADLAERTIGRDGDPAPEERGWLHCGPPGAGHFVKMVHNGIEYGMMAAYAEGLNLLAHANQGAEDQQHDAETAPLEQPEYYRYPLDISKITEVWRRGSVVTSWLLDLTAQALDADPELGGYEGVVSDSGEGRWTINAAVDLGVPVPALSSALFTRFSSRDRDLVGNKVLSAMRAGFGGHAEQKKDEAR